MLLPSAPPAIAVIHPLSPSPVNWPPHTEHCHCPPPAVILSSPLPANQPPAPFASCPSCKHVRYCPNAVTACPTDLLHLKFREKYLQIKVITHTQECSQCTHNVIHNVIHKPIGTFPFIVNNWTTHCRYSSVRYIHIFLVDSCHSTCSATTQTSRGHMLIVSWTCLPTTCLHFPDTFMNVLENKATNAGMYPQPFHASESLLPRKWCWWHQIHVGSTNNDPQC